MPSSIEADLNISTSDLRRDWAHYYSSTRMKAFGKFIFNLYLNDGLENENFPVK